MEKFKFLNKNKVSQLPKSSGVYCFKKNREIFYIGKAANIKERVKNHMQRPVAFWEQTLLRPASTKVSAGKQGYSGQAKPKTENSIFVWHYPRRQVRRFKN